MSRRLERALQRGGVAAQTHPDTWSIWRTADRRGRIIGQLNGAEVDILRLHNKLKPIGGAAPVTLIWCGPIDDAPPITQGPPVLSSQTGQQHESLLELLLRKSLSADLRSQFRAACKAYIEDIACVGAGGGSVTMNWDSFAGADRSKGGRRNGPSVHHHAAAIAKGRLSRVAAACAPSDLAFLDRLVLVGGSRTAIAKHYAIRPALAEQRALSVLRKLASVYDGVG